MKKILLTFALVVACISTNAQGTIYFNNRTLAGDVPVYQPDGVSPIGLYPGGVSAQLFLVSAQGTYTPLSPSTTFRTSSPAAAAFVNPVDVVVPGLPAGTPATVAMRIWPTSYGTFESAQAAGFWGQSALVSIAALGGVNSDTGAIVPTPDLSGLQFFILVPEPSTIAIGILGAAALLYRRRN